MALVDSIQVRVSGGKGGDGVVRWLHIKGKEKGGPAGGNGGRGGDVVLVGVRDLAVLATYRFTKDFKAEAGGYGESNNKDGKGGNSIRIQVPIGTVVTKEENGESFEIVQEGQEVVVAKGGAGGLGNAYFKGSTNQNPFQSTKGKKGESFTLSLSLKLIADAGIIGLPNAGKSSLINTLTNARSRVGSYAFTTLEPHLGEFYGFILADIPGLIEGASKGKGLGFRFLKHIERTENIIHLVSVEQENVVDTYKTVRYELGEFNENLLKKNEVVILSKTDTVPDNEWQEKKQELETYTGKKVLRLSVLDDVLIKEVSDALAIILKKEA